jgi:hypothetical protein
MIFYITCPACTCTLQQEAEAGLQPVCCRCGAIFQVLAEEGFPIANVRVEAVTEIQPTPSPPHSDYPRPETEKRSWVPNLVRSVFRDSDRERTRRIHKGFLTGYGLAWLWGFLQFLQSSDPSIAWWGLLLATVMWSPLTGFFVAVIVAWFLTIDEEQRATGEEPLRRLGSVGEATRQGADPQEGTQLEPSASANPVALRLSESTAPPPPGR